MKTKNTLNDIIKAMNKQRREEEIALYGKTINFTNITKNKKKYTRKEKHKKRW